MPHNSSHVIISALDTPVYGKAKLWHCVLALILAAFVLGLVAA